MLSKYKSERWFTAVFAVFIIVDLILTGVFIWAIFQIIPALVEWLGNQ